MNKILALGAQSKGSFCFVEDGSMHFSDSFGDLPDLKNFNHFQKEIRKFKPDIIACDLHPEYITTKLAYELVGGNLKRIKKIQHHKAHIASCIVDNNVKGKVIGIAFDGTGFGEDGKIWGGEFFIGNLKGFKRVAHLKYIPMPGGEAAVREPWRMAASYLYSIEIHAPNSLIKQIIDKGINSPLTSSVGRLFDAVSAMLDICKKARYEGEAAVELEKAIAHHSEDSFSGFIVTKEGIIAPDKLIKDILKDLKNKVPVGIISLKFHNAICNMIKDVCVLLRKKYNISKVCLSGGVFQNRYLKENIRPLLEEEGFKVYLHKNIPCHDGGIAVGQAALCV